MIRQGFRMYSRRVIKIFVTILENSLFRIRAESVNVRLSVLTLGLVEGVLPAKRVCSGQIGAGSQAMSPVCGKQIRQAVNHRARA